MGSNPEAGKQIFGIEPGIGMNQQFFSGLQDRWERDLPVNRKAEKAGKRREAKRERKIRSCLEKQFRRYIGVQSFISTRGS